MMTCMLVGDIDRIGDASMNASCGARPRVALVRGGARPDASVILAKQTALHHVDSEHVDSEW